MTETEVQKIIGFQRSMSGYIAIPNVSMYAGGGSYYEADLLLINRKNLLLTEVEIKVSFVDFKADFKKKNYHNSKNVAYLHYAIPFNLYKERGDEIAKMLPVGVGLIVAKARMNTFCEARAKKRENVNPLTDSEFKEYLRLGCMKWCSCDGR